MNANCMLKSAISTPSTFPILKHQYKADCVLEYCHGNNTMDNTLVVLPNEKRFIDDDDGFSKEMGPDEHFLGFVVLTQLMTLMIMNCLAVDA
mmetsp:Transcript_23279/g.49147  ORF Transcript_23279/g.49147 Transcript_23279/m.49147 type:complete len:92 (-) Transcript_23279:294-569(-)